LLRGYCKNHDTSSATLGIGIEFHLSEFSWRIRIRQAWLSGLLDRNMQIGHGEGRISSLVFNSYTLSKDGEQFLQSPTSLELPVIEGHSTSSSFESVRSETHDEVRIQGSDKVTQTRQSKGVHLLPVLTTLLSSRTNWYDIESEEHYQYPGVFHVEYPQRLGYVSDIAALSFYTQNDDHFLFNDIQLSKGKLRAPRTVKAYVDGREEFLNYRFAPCRGVKRCSVEDCSYVIPFSERRSCPSHPEAVLLATEECPVEFVYVWPADSKDNRRWLSGIVRVGDLKSNNLHNHDVHGPTKIPSKIVEDIQSAVKLDPTLKTHDLMTGIEINLSSHT